MSSPRKSGPALIAVVDDDASIRLATDSLLRSRGYAVRTFASPGDFLQSAVLNETACVITDVRMPVMGGIELQAILRRRGCTVPFVFITAFPEEVVRVQAMNGGATCFLAKPFDAPALIKYVEAAATVESPFQKKTVANSSPLSFNPWARRSPSGPSLSLPHHAPHPDHIIDLF